MSQAWIEDTTGIRWKSRWPSPSHTRVPATPSVTLPWGSQTFQWLHLPASRWVSRRRAAPRWHRQVFPCPLQLCPWLATITVPGSRPSPLPEDPGPESGGDCGVDRGRGLRSPASAPPPPNHAVLWHPLQDSLFHSHMTRNQISLPHCQGAQLWQNLHLPLRWQSSLGNLLTCVVLGA